MWYADGRPKPAALAQTLFSQMVKYPTRLSATVAPSGLYVLAGRNASGDRAVLLANPTSASVAWSLGGTTGNGRTYRLQQLADTATSITTSSPTGLSGSIPANGVQLLTITAGDGAAITGVAGAGGSVPAVASITSNGYFAIYGSDFAPAGTSREVQQSDLTGNTFPTKLANTCVNVGNTRAYLRYVSPGQINALAPALTGASAQVSVVVNCGTAGEQTSAVVTVPVASAAPEFLYFAQTAGGQNPVVAVDSLTGAYVGQNGLIPGVSFTPAKAGQLVTVFGIGFGRLVSPVSPGTLVTGANGVADGASVSIGGRAATVSYAGATPGFAGLYQVNLVVPAGLSPGNQEVTATINGFETARGGYLTVQ
jgi:uncharacterized protein (TIGR03437 family)